MKLVLGTNDSEGGRLHPDRKARLPYWKTIDGLRVRDDRATRDGLFFLESQLLRSRCGGGTRDRRAHISKHPLIEIEQTSCLLAQILVSQLTRRKRHQGV